MNRDDALDAARRALRATIDGGEPIGVDGAMAVHTALSDALTAGAQARSRAELLARKVAALEHQADDLVAQIVGEEERAKRAERKNRELAEQIVELTGLVRAGLNENLAPVRWRARARAFLGEP